MESYNKTKESIENEIYELLNTFESEKNNYKVKFKDLFNELFKNKNVIILEESPSIMFEVQRRKLYKQRPFQSEKDSFADAIIIETLFDFVETNLHDTDTLVFISKNYKDFALSKTDKEILHSDIAVSVKERKISKQFNFRAHFTRSLIYDFEEEAEKVGFLEDLILEWEAEEIELQIEKNRESGNLPSLKADWEEIISDSKDIKDFIDELDRIFDLVRSHNGWLEEEYEELIDNINASESIKIEEIEKRIDEQLERKLVTNSINIDSKKNKLISEINDYIGIELEDLNSNQHYEERFYINDSILRLSDLNNNSIELVTEGYLQPANDETDSIMIIVKDRSDKLLYEGKLEVNYGYMNFEENQAADGAMYSVEFDYEDIIEIIEEFVDDLIYEIEVKREFIKEINNFEE